MTAADRSLDGDSRYLDMEECRHTMEELGSLCVQFVQWGPVQTPRAGIAAWCEDKDNYLTKLTRPLGQPPYHLDAWWQPGRGITGSESINQNRVREYQSEQGQRVSIRTGSEYQSEQGQRVSITHISASFVRCAVPWLFVTAYFVNGQSGIYNELTLQSITSHHMKNIINHLLIVQFDRYFKLSDLPILWSSH